MRPNSDSQGPPAQSHQDQVRRDLATATVGLLIALAFGAMVDAVKDPLRASVQVGHPHGLLLTTSLMALIFFFIGFSFFLGSQMYLGDPAVELQNRLQWRWDFFSTVLTLTFLVLLGAYTNPAFKSAFVLVSGCLFGFQLIWALPHILWKSVRIGWLLTNVVACGATFWIYFHLDLGLNALILLAVVYLAKLVYDMVYIPI